MSMCLLESTKVRLRHYLLQRRMARLLREKSRPEPRLRALPRENRYVAFLDILGFGHRVEEDFEDALETYDEVFEQLRYLGPNMFPSLSLSVISDSILVTSPNFWEIVQVCSSLQFLTLTRDCLLRGGIAFDAHLQTVAGDNLYVVSRALVAAVRLERTISRPCVAIHSSVSIPPSAYLRPNQSNFERLLLFFDGLWIVNPFNPLWGHSAMTRVCQLQDRYPQYAEKYEWFLRLYQAVRDGAPLIPPSDH